MNVRNRVSSSENKVQSKDGVAEGGHHLRRYRSVRDNQREHPALSSRRTASSPARVKHHLVATTSRAGQRIIRTEEVARTTPNNSPHRASKTRSNKALGIMETRHLIKRHPSTPGCLFFYLQSITWSRSN